MKSAGGDKTRALLCMFPFVFFVCFSRVPFVLSMLAYITVTEKNIASSLRTANIIYYSKLYIIVNLKLSSPFCRKTKFEIKNIYQEFLLYK